MRLTRDQSQAQGSESAPSLDDSPIGADEFARLMAALGCFPPAPSLAVGLSGGPDSMALTLLASRWCAERGGRLLALTVDHGLRPESAVEARQTAERAAALGVDCRVLSPAATPISGNLQAAARRMRYSMLADACRGAGIVDLLIAHAQDDQAETFMMRLARGSGLDGLSAMAPVSALGALRLLRPLLDVRRARLRATVVSAQQPFVDDPSNHDPRFARVRLRRSARLLEDEGLSHARLARTIAHLARARDALSDNVAEIAARTARVLPFGAIVLDIAPLRSAPDEIATRLLSRCLGVVSGSDHPIRYQKVSLLRDRFLLEQSPKRATLGGCVLTPLDRRGDGRILISREPRAIGPDVGLDRGYARWDGRFDAETPVGSLEKGLSIGALTSAGWRQARGWLRDSGRKPAFPAMAMHALPAVYDEQGLSAVPHLEIGRPRSQAPRIRLSFLPPRCLTPPGLTRNFGQ